MMEVLNRARHSWFAASVDFWRLSDIQKAHHHRNESDSTPRLAQKTSSSECEISKFELSDKVMQRFQTQILWSPAPFCHPVS